MALVLADRVLETTTSTGSGTITLAGAKQGYQSFAAVGNNNQTYYTISGGAEWEVGIGTYTASGTTLSRDTVLSSSDNGTKVTFSAGTKDVFVTYPAGRSVYGNETGTVTITSLAATSAIITNLSATSLTLTNALNVAEGGTGVDSTPTNGQLLIGNGTAFTLSTLTAGTGVSVTNATGSITIAASGGLPTVTVTASTAITAAVSMHYVLTAATAATVTLPASPTISDTIYVTVANGLTTNSVARNGKNIQGLAEDLTLNATYASVQLRYSDATEGWIFA